MNKFFKKYGILFYVVVLSFLILLFTSKNSFLYPLNDWVDANAFFTMGKSMMNGVVPYKDLFEQKGILLYFIYGLGYLISGTSFYGVFIFEVLFFAVFLYFAYKSITLFLDKKYAYIILPIMALLITTSYSFTHGGSAEEFCLPFLAIGLYYFLHHFKVKSISYKELFLCGLCAGAIFLIKYTLLGFYIAFMAFIFINLITKKEIKKGFLSCIVFLLGMFSPIAIALLYLGLNGAIKDAYLCYFKINMTAYNTSKESIFLKLKSIFEGTIGSLASTGIITCLLLVLMPSFVGQIKIKKEAKYYIVFSMIIMLFFLFFGLRFYRYYIIPVFVFLIISFIGLFSYFKPCIDLFFKKKYSNIVLIAIFLLSVLSSYEFCNYKDMILTKKEDMLQYKFKDYISDYDNPTLLNMGYLDAGLYTTTGIIPNTKFFEVQNISYSKFPDNLDDIKANVINKNIMFVVYFTKDDLDSIKEDNGFLFDNYELVLSESQKFEEAIYNAYLFKVITEV